MKIKNWKLYAPDGSFIMNIKVFIRSMLVIAGGTMLLFTIFAMIFIYFGGVVDFLHNMMY